MTKDIFKLLRTSPKRFLLSNQDKASTPRLILLLFHMARFVQRPTLCSSTRRQHESNLLKLIHLTPKRIAFSYEIKHIV